MKKVTNILLALVIPSAILISCIEDQKDFRYNGPSVAEFKNYYLEQQSRLGTANFQALNYNVVTLENTQLTKLTVRQPATLRTGTITASLASTAVTGAGTQFTTELAVGSIVKNASGTIIGYVASITDNTNLVLTANALVAATAAPYRASLVPSGGLVFSDSILVQLVGRQVSSDISVTYMEDPDSPLAPEGAVEAIEGVHFNFVRNAAGELVINGDSNAGYIYIDVLDGLAAADPARVTLMITLTEDGDIAPSQNYKTFTYNIIK